MMRIILATRNISKATQIKSVFKETPIEVVTLTEVGIVGDVVEDTGTLEGNSLKKARFARDQSGAQEWVMADDTGLFITELNGDPGVEAAYWGGKELSVVERQNYCLEQMKAVSNREATFRTVVAVISPRGEEHVFAGEVLGRLLEVPPLREGDGDLRISAWRRPV